MKSLVHSSLFVLALGITQLHSSANPVLDQDFDNVSTGKYVSGMGFGTEAIEGVATSRYPTALIQDGVGLGGSRAYGIEKGNPAVRTMAQLPTETPTAFSFAFRFAGSESANVGFVGAGWALEAGADDSNFYELNETDRLLVGLATKADPVEVAFAHMGKLSEEHYIVPRAERYATLTPGHWYKVSFTLRHDGGPVWIADNLTLQDLGADGTTEGEVLLQELSARIRAPYATNINEATEAYAVFAGNGVRGAAFLDNLKVSQEP